MTTPEINASQLRLYYLQQLGIAAYVPRGMSAENAAVVASAALQQEEAATAAMVAETQISAPRIATTIAAGLDDPLDGKLDGKNYESSDESRNESSDQTIHDTRVARPTSAAEPRPASARRLMMDETGIAPPVAPMRAAVTAVATTAISETDDDNTPPFQLLFAVLDPELAIALQIPALATNGLREQEQKLLQNLLRWLGYSLPELKSPLQYRWPLPGLPATSAAMATRTLSVFLQQAASTRPFRHLLLLGPVPAQCLQDQPATWQLWPTHSLAELLALPQLKRDSWLQLQPLQRELQQRLH